jgi:seryl-tRNA synthetase
MENDKELSVVKTQLTKASSVVAELVIATPEDYKHADEILGKVKQVGKLVKEKKEEITQPINSSLKKIRDLFKPLETKYEEIEMTIKTKMLSYRKAEDARIEADKKKIADKVESGYIKTETAIAKLETVGDTKADLKSAGVKTSVRKLPRVKIVDATLIPREYLLVDTAKVLADLKTGVVVAGAELYYEEIIA